MPTAIIVISTPATRSQWDGETRARCIAARHGPADATLALIIAALRSAPSPPTAILPKTQVKVLPRASRKGRRMRARQRAKRPSPSQIAIRAHFVRARRPPILPSQVPAASPGDGSRVFVASASDWFKCGGKDRHAPKSRINQRSRASPLAYRLRPGRTYLTTASHRPVRGESERLNLAARQRD